jgi:lysophospholipase L1-like esterase
VSARSKLANLLKNLALSAAAFFLCFVVLEITLRYFGYGNIEIYQPDPKLYWRLRPNQNCFTKIDHKPVHINSRGTRGPDFAVPKPSQTIRVLSLGDSRTFGWGLSDEETYSALLQTCAQPTVGPGKKVEVINAGVNAWSYPQMLVYFREYGLSYQPDIVLLADANPWTQFSETNDPAFIRSVMRRVQLKNFLRHFAAYHFLVEVQLRNFYRQERTKFIPVDPQHDALFKGQQQSDPNEVFRNAIVDLCQLALERNVKPVLLFQPTVDDLTKSPPILETKRQVSAQLNVPLVDLTSEVRLQGKTLYLPDDSAHLNARGNELIAARLCQTINPLIKP